MAVIQERTLVSSAQESVWNTVVDFESRARYSQRVKEARVVEGGPLQKGSRIRLRIDRNTFTPTVMEVPPPSRLVLLVTGPGFRAYHTYEVAASSSGTTVTLKAEHTGILGMLMGRLLRGSVRKDLRDELVLDCVSPRYLPGGTFCKKFPQPPSKTLFPSPLKATGKVLGGSRNSSAEGFPEEVADFCN